MGGKRTPAQVPALRRSFELPQPVESARLYITALGVYDVEINGVRAHRRRTRARLDRLRQTRSLSDVRRHAVAEAWRECRSACCSATAGTAARSGLSDRQQYGDRPLLLAQLEITLADGTPMRVATDDLWKWHRSQILYSDIMSAKASMRDRVSARGAAPGYDAAGWSQVDVLPLRHDVALDANASPPIRVVDRIAPTADPSRRSGDFGVRRLIYDFGQNIVGRVRIKVRAPRGTLIEIRHAERLDDSGELYTANLRKAAATDLYTCSGESGRRSVRTAFHVSRLSVRRNQRTFRRVGDRRRHRDRARVGAAGDR